jgi:hypothetical protein
MGFPEENLLRVCKGLGLSCTSDPAYQCFILCSVFSVNGLDIVKLSQNAAHIFALLWPLPMVRENTTILQKLLEPLTLAKHWEQTQDPKTTSELSQ